MSPHPDHHSVRRITLPSGRSIEVVRFHDDQAPPARGLHICLRCDCELVQPRAWSEVPDGRWELTLECPNCAWSEVGIFDRCQLEALEEQLDDGLASMLEDVRRLTQVNMHDEIERFVAALASDLILPEDF